MALHDLALRCFSIGLITRAGRRRLEDGTVSGIDRVVVYQAHQHAEGEERELTGALLQEVDEAIQQQGTWETICFSTADGFVPTRTEHLRARAEYCARTLTEAGLANANLTPKVEALEHSIRLPDEVKSVNELIGMQVRYAKSTGERERMRGLRRIGEHLVALLEEIYATDDEL